MNADKGVTIFRELSIGLSVPCSLIYYDADDPTDRYETYQIEISTPLPRGTRRDIQSIRDRYGVNEFRIPAYNRAIGGKLIWT